MRKPRFIHSPAANSSPLAVPRFSRPIHIRYLPRLPYSSFSTRPPSTHSVTFQDPPRPTHRRPAFDRSLVNLDVISTLVSPGYLSFDQTQERTTQVRFDLIAPTRNLIVVFRFRARAKLPAAAARTFIPFGFHFNRSSGGNPLPSEASIPLYAAVFMKISLSILYQNFISDLT